MTLDKWTDNDIITEVNANKRGIRRGTTTDRDALASGVLSVGDSFFNETEECMQILIKKGPDKWQSLRTLLGADSTEVSIQGTTPTQVKDLDYIKDITGGFPGNVVFISARLKNSNGGNNATLIVERDGGPTDEITLITSSTSYVNVSGTIDISGDGEGLRTLEFFINSGGAPDTASLKQLEIYGV